MTKRTFQTIQRALEKKRNEVGRARDGLRDLQGEIEDLAETCDRAYDALNEAIDALSELA